MPPFRTYTSYISGSHQEATVSPRGWLPMSGITLVVNPGGCCSHLLSKAGEAAEHPTIPSTAPNHQELPGPKGQ